MPRPGAQPSVAAFEPPDRPTTSLGAPARVAENDVRPESQLRAEAALLHSARAALRAGDVAAAFAALEAARARFPKGALVQEREALVIELLAKSGQREAARASAGTFLKTFPESSLAPRVRELAE